MAPLVVDCEDKLKFLLAHLARRTREQCLIFIDLEGVNLSRNGTVAIMQLLIPPEPVVYLVDVHVLSSKAFNLIIDSGTSLRSVLESSSSFKVFFDIRNDSDALYAHFGIQVAGVIDLQILEYATRKPRGGYLNGLAKCIERDLPYVPGWSVTKAKGRRLFRPEEGGSYEVFLERPIRDDIAEYCEQDVMLMPHLLARYGPKVDLGVASRLQVIVDDRIALSKSEAFRGKGRHMAIGPNLGYHSANINAEISPEINLVRSAQLQELCKLNKDSVTDLVADFDALNLKPTTLTPDSSEPSTTDPVDSAGVPTAISSSKASTPPKRELGPIASALASSMANVGHHSDESSDDELGVSYHFHNSYSYGNSNSDQDCDYTACSAEDCGYCGKCMY